MKNKIKYSIITLSVIFIFSIGYGLGRGVFFCSGKKYLSQRIEDGYRYLGKVRGKEIYVSYFITENDAKRKNFALKLDDDYIYWESDRNSDGKIDNIKHFEKGILIYESEDTNFDGDLNRKMVESYRKDGSHHITMVDLNADNEFDLRIKNFNEDNQFVEIFVNNEWTKRIKENGVYGIHNAKGIFLPVKFKNNKWQTLGI